MLRIVVDLQVAGILVLALSSWGFYIATGMNGSKTSIVRGDLWSISAPVMVG